MSLPRAHAITSRHKGKPPGTAGPPSVASRAVSWFPQISHGPSDFAPGRRLDAQDVAGFDARRIERMLRIGRDVEVRAPGAAAFGGRAQERDVERHVVVADAPGQLDGVPDIERPFC